MLTLRRAGLVLAALFTLSLSLAPGAALAQTASAVTISDFQFTPASLSVPVGTKVTWTNNGPSAHTASDQGVFDSGTLQPGQSFSFTFASAGTFNYRCNIHPFMTAVINVTAASQAPAPAPASAPASAAPAPASASPAAAPASRAATPARSTSTAGAAPAPVQAPSALPKTGEGGGASTPVWAWLSLALAASVVTGWLVRRYLRVKA